jgi:Holliday junction resolvase RusA-like endonuclease
MKIIIPIKPIGKPRMTQRDVWAKRTCVVKYRQFCDDLRRHTDGIEKSCTGSLSFVAYMPIPQSWSKKKKKIHPGAPHQSTPDADNILKAICDALFKEDSHIYKGSFAKYWDDGGGPRIELSFE